MKNNNFSKLVLVFAVIIFIISIFKMKSSKESDSVKKDGFVGPQTPPPKDLSPDYDSVKNIQND